MESAEQLNEEAQGFLSNVVDSAALMGRMLDGLLALSRVGTAPLNPQPVALDAVLQAAGTAVQARYPDRAVDWQPASDFPRCRPMPPCCNRR